MGLNCPLFVFVRFGSCLASSADAAEINITLEGQDPVLPGATKITLIVPSGGLDEAVPEAPGLM